MAGPIQNSMERKFREAFNPAKLSVKNQSHKHAGHAGNPTGAADAETHFDVEIVSEAFQGQSLVARHRQVYAVVKEELDAGLHALSMKLKTPQETTR